MICLFDRLRRRQAEALVERSTQCFGDFQIDDFVARGGLRSIPTLSKGLAFRIETA